MYEMQVKDVDKEGESGKYPVVVCYLNEPKRKNIPP
jgi:hypothetical protein